MLGKNIYFVDLINEFAKKLLNWQFCKVAIFGSLVDIWKLNNDAQHPEKQQKISNRIYLKFADMTHHLQEICFNFLLEK